MPNITVILDSAGNKKTLEVSPEESLLQALTKQGLYVKSSCGGVASCGDCVIKVIAGSNNLSPSGFEETGLLGNVFHITGERLSCQAKASGGATIDISHHDQKKDQEQLKKRTSSRHKVRKREKVEALKQERIKEQDQEQKWERHWEKGSDRTPPHKQGGHRRPHPFRTDHLDEDKD